MRVFNNGTSRPAWYDRGPLEIAKYYFAQAVAPHGVTTRWTYTVPAARKCLVELTQVTEMRDVAAGVAGTTNGFIRVVTAGAVTLDFAFTVFQNVNVDTYRQCAMAPQAVMLATSVVSGSTIDSSTGGSVTYNIAMKGTEYDA